MIQSIAIQAYFAQMRYFFTRQGFDLGTRVIYGADAQGNLDLLDKDLASKDMAHKGETNREIVRSNPYTYLFWTKGKAENIVRRSAYIRDGIDPKTGAAHYRKVVSIKFPLILAFISNKGNTVEDFEEAFAAEWQNIHNAPISLKWAFPDESETIADDLWMNATVIQELGSSEMVSYRPGDLFAYSWVATIHLNVAGEFASKTLRRLKRIIVDLYNKEGVPLSSMDITRSITNKTGNEAICEAELELTPGEQYTVALGHPEDLGIPVFQMLALDGNEVVPLIESGGEDLEAAEPSDPSAVVFFIRSKSVDGVLSDLVVVRGDEAVKDEYDIKVPADSQCLVVGGTLDPYSNVCFTVSPGSTRATGLWETYTSSSGKTFLVPKIPTYQCDLESDSRPDADS